MPISIEFLLKIIHNEFTENDLSPLNNALYAFLLNWLIHGDKKTALKIHDGNTPNPFTISPLMYNQSNSDETARFRITLLDDSLLNILEKVSYRHRGFNIGKSIVAIDEQRITKQEKYAEIAEKSRISRNVILKFESPTGFRSFGKPNAQPDPKMVFTSLFQRWNTFAPTELQIADNWVDWVSVSTFISRAESVTETLKYLRSSIPVFTAKVQYEFVKDRRFEDFDGATKVADALANFAYYGGVGAYTSRGLGQVRKLEKWMETKFFISYSSKDGNVAEQISSALQNAGYSTWLDKKDIVIGQPILDRVSKGIESESDFVIILVSENSADSEWCKLELRMAYQKELHLKRIVVLPIKIDDVEVPPEIMTKKYFQLNPRSKISINSLLQEISAFVKAAG